MGCEEGYSMNGEDVLHCNHCGAELDMWDLQQDYTIHTTCGYGSRHDMQEIDLRLCCACFDAIIDGCKISPVVQKE